MSEWQPARLVKLHERDMNLPTAQTTRAMSEMGIVRVREVFEGVAFFVWRAMGCDATRFFHIHDEDSGCHNACVCEHEILTD